MADDAKKDIIDASNIPAKSAGEIQSAPASTEAGAPSVTPPPVPVAAPAPPPAAVPAPAPEAMAHDLSADVAKILEEVKLPERYEYKGVADAKKIPTAPPLETLDAPPAPVPTPAQKDEPAIASLHTLKDDIQHVVHDEKMSLVRAASLEQDRKAREKEATIDAPGNTQRSKRVFAVLFTAILLVVLGVAALLGVQIVANSSATPQQPQLQSLIFAEQTLALPLDNSDPTSLKQQVAQARNGNAGTLGSITRIVPTVSTSTSDGQQAVRAATTAEFFQSLGAQLPDELSRALGSEFFLGIHAVDKNAPAIVISVASYDHAFAGMLAWESTMNADLAPIFTPVSAYTRDASGIPQARNFGDAVMRNYDARVLKDDSGNIVLYYSFPTPNILVIGESPYTFTEVLSRLQASRRL